MRNLIFPSSLLDREELGEQKGLADEIGNAIANGPASGGPIDEDELEDDLARLEQEDLDEKMLKTGTVPVLPTGLNTQRKPSSIFYIFLFYFLPPFDIIESLTSSPPPYVQTVKDKSRITPAAAEEEEDEEAELRKLQAEMAM